jgi:hypothetical protein
MKQIAPPHHRFFFRFLTPVLQLPEQSIQNTPAKFKTAVA